MLYAKDAEKNISGRIVMIVFTLALVPVFLGIWTSSNCAKFGMTCPEMTSEAYLIALYFIVGTLGIIFVGRLIKNRYLIFLIRLTIFAAVIVTCHNQLAVSKALAPVKREFAKASGACRVRDGELFCGNKLDQVLKKRDEELRRLKSTRLGEWKVTAISRDIFEFNRDSAYFYSPF